MPAILAALERVLAPLAQALVPHLLAQLENALNARAATVIGAPTPVVPDPAAHAASADSTV
jgi:hypothetical protein